MTLSENPEIGVQQQQVVYEQGVLRQTSGMFDTTFSGNGTQSYSQTPQPSYAVLQDEYQYGIVAPSIDANTTQVNASGTKLFRNGIEMQPQITLDRTRDNLTNRNGLEQANIGYQVKIPLFRNRGRDVVAGQETSARINVQASFYDLNQTVAQLLANTASAYWDDVAAQDQLRVAVETEKRGHVILEETQALIDGDQEPKSDINQVAANLSNRISGRIAAEQTAIQSHQQLAIAMGLRQDQLNQLPNPSEVLPKTRELIMPAADAFSIQSDITVALRLRADVLAARARVDAARVLLPAARNAVLPEIDAGGSVGYAGLKEAPAFGATFYPPFLGSHGVQASASLSFNFSRANNTAVGQLEQATASLRQAQLKYDDTARNAASGVITALAGVRTAGERLRSAAESVRHFQTALDAERAKREIGVTTITNVLDVEDRLTNAQQTEVSARASYVSALVQLRFATGTIVAPDKPAQTVSAEIFTRIPSEVVPLNAH